MDKFLVIDGNSLINRAFYALPMLANFDGVVSNGVFGFSNILVKAINEISPKYLCVAFDFGKKTFRNDLYSEYKGTRKPTPVELKQQFPILKEMLALMNIKFIEIEGVEADDIIGTLSKKYSDIETVILTGDKDAFQLVDSTTKVMFTKKGISETVVYDTDKLKEDYEISPSQVVDMKSLVGDVSDNIPGVAGVGEKTALTLLKDYNTLDGVYDNIDKITGKLKEKLESSKEIAYLSYKLATINTSVDINTILDDFLYEFPFNANVMKFFEKYQFNSLLKRKELFKDLDNSSDVSDIKKSTRTKKVVLSNINELNNIIKKLGNIKYFSFYINDVFNFYVDGVEYEINFNSDLLTESIEIDVVLKSLQEIFENKNVEKIVYDYKKLLHQLKKYNIDIKGEVFDVMIARYLINNNAKSNLAFLDVITEQGLDNNFISSNLYELYVRFGKKIDELELTNLFYDVEMPLCRVLFDMEVSGFKIDYNMLKELDDKYLNEINLLTENIYKQAGEVFNINSPKQLGVVLFDNLKLVAYNNKSKSTNIEVLNEIKNQHYIVELIIEYRKLTKIYNTYIKSFENLMDKNTGKIHTEFNQTLTSTGRLSSIEPNLQNIPIRSEEGRALRKIFISSFDDGCLVGADYSQIELRLLASFSNDEKLISAFNNGVDIHSQTASEIFNVEIGEVSPQMRRDAKAINFGIIYGISPYGLSQNIGTSADVAKKYIDKYFVKYPKVRTYMDSNIEFCKTNGFIKTLMGRIRFVLEINSSNFNLRNFGERAAMNMPLQGSASDIIKVAMININNEFLRKGMQSKLILQIHDELIIDCKNSEYDEVVKTLKDIMENVVELPVKLEVNIESGKNWFEAK